MTPTGERPFLTFGELVEEMGGRTRDVNNLRYKLVTGQLVPSLHVAAQCQRVTWSGNDFTLAIADGQPVVEKLHGFFYAQRPLMTGALDCTFAFVTREPHPRPESGWWQLPAAASLDYVLQNGVIDCTQAQAAEGKRPRRDAPDPRERNSMLRIILGTAIGGYGFDPRVKRSAIAGEIADDVATHTGQKIDSDTVRKYLTEAAGAFIPANWQPARETDLG